MVPGSILARRHDSKRQAQWQEQAAEKPYGQEQTGSKVRSQASKPTPSDELPEASLTSYAPQKALTTRTKC